MNREALVTLGAEKLTDMLLALRKGRREVNLELDVVLAGAEKTPDMLVDLLRKEISTLQNMETFYSFDRTDLVAYRMDALRRYITDDLKTMSATKAIELLLEFIHTYEHVKHHVDDHGRLIESVFIEAYDDLNKLCRHAKAPAEALADAIAKRCIHDLEGTYCDLLFEFKDVLQDEVLDLIKEKIEQSLNDDDSEYEAQQKIDKIKDIAEIRQDADAYIQACNIKGGPSDYDCIRIAKELVKQQRAAEALTWLDKVDESEKGKHHQSVYIRALIGIGEYEKAQEQCLDLFDKELDANLYKEVMAHIRPEDKTSFQKEVLQKALKSSHFKYYALEFLVKIENYEEAAKFIRLNIDNLPAYSIWALSINCPLQKVDPLAATLLYRKMIAYILKEDKSEDYEYAAHYLVVCAVLSTEVNDWEKVTPHEAYISAIREGYECNEEFWSIYASAVQQLLIQTEKYSKP